MVLPELIAHPGLFLIQWLLFLLKNLYRTLQMIMLDYSLYFKNYNNKQKLKLLLEGFDTDDPDFFSLNKTLTIAVQNYIIATKIFTVWFLCVCVCTYLRLVFLLFVFVFIFFLCLSILYISKEKVLDKIYLIFWLNPWTIYSKIQDGWWYLVSCIFI